MFERLRKKWRVGPLQLFLILCTFAIGGSMTGYAAKKLINLFDIDLRWLWILVYIILVTLIWPLSVLVVSLFFGQFRFFMGYLRKMANRMGLARSKNRQPDLSNKAL